MRRGIDRAPARAAETIKPTFFATPAAFRAWLERHHASRDELWVGFHKKGTGRASITWPESVDEALCFGWIDGLRKGVDESSYTIRFTPRRATSIWSAVNIRSVARLAAEGRMRPAGEAAFAARTEAKSRVYSFESKPVALAPEYERALRENRRASEFFDAQPPWYRRTTAFWVMSAKRDETRARRLAALIACCAKGEAIPVLKRTKSASSESACNERPSALRELPHANDLARRA